MPRPESAKTCLLCDSPNFCKGLCHKHVERWRRWGQPPLDAWVAAFLAERLNTCVACGKRWNGYRNRTTCSAECDKERRRRIGLAAYHAKSPEEKRKIVDRHRAATRAKAAASLRDITCVICGKVFAGHPRRRFCSKACNYVDVCIRRDEIRSRVRFFGRLKAAESLMARLDETEPRPRDEPESEPT